MLCSFVCIPVHEQCVCIHVHEQCLCIHVHEHTSILAIGVDNTQQTTSSHNDFIKHSHEGLKKTLEQPLWLRKIISHNGLENKKPQWFRK